MRTAIAVLFTMAALCAGCAQEQDQAIAEASVDAVQMAETESGLMSVVLDTRDDGMTPQEAAAEAAGMVDDIFAPAGCGEAVADGTDVTFTLEGCTARYGLGVAGKLSKAHSRDITGVYDVSFSEAAGASTVAVDIAGNDVHVGDAVIDMDGTGTYSADGEERTLVLETDTTGISPRGYDLARQGSYTRTWDQATECRTLTGTWDTQVGNRAWETTVSGFSRCADGCPKAGGKITFHGKVRDITVTVTFDGSNVASWESSRGGDGEVELDCE
jgi:hypothetical protein